MIPINYFAILACGVASMVLGFLWYGPLFGKTWIRLMGWSSEKMDEMKKKGMAAGYAISFVGALVMAYVLSHSLAFASAYLAGFGLSAGFMAGFWSWLGFIAPVTLGMVLWEGKSWKLWVLHNGYWLALLLVMGAILALWPATA